MKRLPASWLRRLPAEVRAAAALEQLEPRDRHVLALLLLERLTPLEAAGALGATVAEIERRRDAALEAIAKMCGAKSTRRRRAA